MNFTQPIPIDQNKLRINNIHSVLEFQNGVGVIKHSKECQNTFDVKMALENKMALLKLCGNYMVPLLVDFTEFESNFPLYSPVAKGILMEGSVQQKRAGIALLFDNENQVKNAYSFHSLNKNNIPLKFFTNKEEAVLWLQSFILN